MTPKPWTLTLWLALSLVAIPSLALPRTWYVKPDGSGDAPTIQAAVDSASEGDIVLVAPGSYSDTSHVWIGDSLEVVNVHLTKNIKLRAEGDPSNTTIGWTESDIAIYVSGVDSTCEIRGFRIETTFSPYGCVDGAAAAPMANLRVGIRCSNSRPRIVYNEIANHGSAVELDQSPVRFENNLMHHSELGISCDNGSDAIIQHNTLHTCGQLIICTNSAPQITDSEMTNGCGAVDCNSGGNAYVARNSITDMHSIAIICGEAAPLIEDNVFRDNDVGVFLSSGSQTPVIRANVFYNHLGWVFDIWLNPNAVIENNTIDLCPAAFVCEGGSNPLIRNNIVTRATTGLHCFDVSSPTMQCNDFSAVQYPYGGNCPDQTGVNGNFSLDPQFCGDLDSGNYRLQSDSPCAPGNHPDGYACGLIGAQDVRCGLAPTTQSSWGSIKSRFRKENQK